MNFMLINNKSKNLAVYLLISLVASSFFVFKITIDSQSLPNSTEDLHELDYVSHSPIEILNNSAFGPSGYNFPGAGTIWRSIYYYRL